MIFIPAAAPACISNACRQGRMPCPTPDVCRVSSIMAEARQRCRAQMADDIMSAQAAGARMCGAWPYVGTPTSPGPLTEAELDRHNAEMHPRMPRSRPPVLPLSVTPEDRDAHPAEAISGPHSHRMTLLDRIVWKWRVWRAERMKP